MMSTALKFIRIAIVQFACGKKITALTLNQIVVHSLVHLVPYLVIQSVFFVTTGFGNSNIDCEGRCFDHGVGLHKTPADSHLKILYNP